MICYFRYPRFSNVLVVGGNRNGGQDGDDRHDDHQFNECEAGLLLHSSVSSELSVWLRAEGPLPHEVKHPTCQQERNSWFSSVSAGAVPRGRGEQGIGPTGAKFRAGVKSPLAALLG